MDEEKEQLFDLIEKVRRRFDSKSGNQNADLDLRHCRWDQVMQEVANTSRRYRGMAKTSKTAQCINKLGTYSGAFEAWLGLLPQGDYGARYFLIPSTVYCSYSDSICGAFKLAVGVCYQFTSCLHVLTMSMQAAGQYTKVEDAIFEALSDIPGIIDNTRGYIQCYADIRDSSLERMTFDLFRAILRTLTLIMRFFADSTIRKFFLRLTRHTDI